MSKKTGERQTFWSRNKKSYILLIQRKNQDLSQVCKNFKMYLKCKIVNCLLSTAPKRLDFYFHLLSLLCLPEKMKGVAIK